MELCGGKTPSSKKEWDERDEWGGDIKCSRLKLCKKYLERDKSVYLAFKNLEKAHDKVDSYTKECV